MNFLPNLRIPRFAIALFLNVLYACFLIIQSGE